LSVAAGLAFWPQPGKIQIDAMSKQTAKNLIESKPSEVRNRRH
jgi:hypothetical protein